jgi:hypothetical protein
LATTGPAFTIARVTPTEHEQSAAAFEPNPTPDQRRNFFRTMGTDAKTLTFSQKMLYFSQACDAFVYRKFKTLGHMLHDYQWRFLIIPLLLMLPMM